MHMVELTPTEFQRFQKLIFETSGISLNHSKQQLVQVRLAKRLRALGLENYAQYYEAVTTDRSGNEMREMLDCISTNLTGFFREPVHFEYLDSTLLPKLVMEKRRKGERKIRVWSAGCSTGEEPYSIAITLLDNIREAGWDAKVLATDISSAALAQAVRGIYPQASLNTLPSGAMARHFQEGRGLHDGQYKVCDEVHSMVVFSRLNLMDEAYPFQGPFDFVFCRNVLIYFERDTQQCLVKRFHRYLSLEGHLFLGHAESITAGQQDFEYVKPTIYRKLETDRCVGV